MGDEGGGGGSTCSKKTLNIFVCLSLFFIQSQQYLKKKKRELNYPTPQRTHRAEWMSTVVPLPAYILRD